MVTIKDLTLLSIPLLNWLNAECLSKCYMYQDKKACRAGDSASEQGHNVI